MAITGTAEVFEKHIPRVRSSHVTIEFGTPFLIKELEPEQKNSRELIQKNGFWRCSGKKKSRERESKWIYRKFADSWMRSTHR